MKITFDLQTPNYEKMAASFVKRLLQGLPIIWLAMAFLFVFIYTAHQFFRKIKWTQPGPVLQVRQEAHLMALPGLGIFISLVIIFETISYVFSGKTFCNMFKGCTSWRCTEEISNNQDSKTIKPIFMLLLY